jgi:peroxiredoxin
MKLKTIIAIILFSVSLTFASHKIEVSIKDAPEGNFYLFKIRGETHIKTDSAHCSHEHLFFKGTYEPGMYYIHHGRQAFSFLINEPHIKFATDAASMKKSLKIIKSKENELWLNYLKSRDQVFQKMEVLKSISIWFDRKTEVYKSAKKEYDQVQKELHSFLKKKHSKTQAEQFILADLNPKLQFELPFDQQKDFLKEHWFDYVNWDEPALINSDILTNKIKDYLNLYSSRSKKGLELQENYKSAVDHILLFALENEQVNRFVQQYLVKRFELFSMEEVLAYMATEYAPVEQSCGMENSDAEILERLRKYAQLSIGKKALDISLPDINGKNRTLSRSLKSKNLVLFWSSQCHHCVTLLPQIQEWYKSAKLQGWSLYTVSLDKESKKLESIIKEHKLDFPVASDFKGWNSKAALDYNIHATPSMIVLDNNRTILGKPLWLAELEAF